MSNPRAFMIYPQPHFIPMGTDTKYYAIVRLWQLIEDSRGPLAWPMFLLLMVLQVQENRTRQELQNIGRYYPMQGSHPFVKSTATVSVDVVT